MISQLLRLKDPLGMRVILGSCFSFNLFVWQRSPLEQTNDPTRYCMKRWEKLLAELDSNRSTLAADKCPLYSLVNRLVLPQFAVGKISRLILGPHFKAASPICEIVSPVLLWT
ncbi:MAG: hypothetical protein Ct9H300mP14_02100 [Gammaproteobacteria bacterium]|nr:MAG: hypothetical protein Ct9H300mP14_02100 [Gammaproteobacteria bacterium]